MEVEVAGCASGDKVDFGVKPVARTPSCAFLVNGDLYQLVPRVTDQAGPAGGGGLQC